MFIQVQATPNPQTMKFIPGIQVLERGTFNFTLGDDVGYIPIIRDLFKVDGVCGVFMTEDFITITKTPEAADWDSMKPILLSTMIDHLASGRPLAIVERKIAQEPSLETEIVRQICTIIEEQVAPAVRGDGGDIVYRDFVDGVVYLELRGSCSGCPSASVTLKSGVENMLRHYVPEVKRVEAVQ